MPCLRRFLSGRKNRMTNSAVEDALELASEEIARLKSARDELSRQEEENPLQPASAVDPGEVIALKLQKAQPQKRKLADIAAKSGAIQLKTPRKGINLMIF